jgi:hypothetical protein
MSHGDEFIVFILHVYSNVLSARFKNNMIYIFIMQNIANIFNWLYSLTE